MNEVSKEAILVLEDDPLVAQMVVSILEEYGFYCRWFRTATEFLEFIKGHSPVLCVVDLGLPDRDGLDVVRELRQKSDCGVIILTARGFLSDRVLGLELGADDYVVKPFEPRELVARVRSVLRRHEPGGDSSGKAGARIACFDGWQFDTATFRLTSPDGYEEILGAADARLLCTLLENPDHIQSRQQLSGSRNWLPYDRSIDIRIARLRKKLRDDSHNPKLVKSVYGVGYLFAVNVTWTNKPR